MKRGQPSASAALTSTFSGAARVRHHVGVFGRINRAVDRRWPYEYGRPTGIIVTGVVTLPPESPRGSLPVPAEPLDRHVELVHQVTSRFAVGLPDTSDDGRP
jgi:hypothetical protein